MAKDDFHAQKSMRSTVRFEMGVPAEESRERLVRGMWIKKRMKIFAEAAQPRARRAEDVRTIKNGKEQEDDRDELGGQQ